jgi:hypothetical protein
MRRCRSFLVGGRGRDSVAGSALPSEGHALESADNLKLTSGKVAPVMMSLLRTSSAQTIERRFADRAAWYIITQCALGGD